ncbi:MAG: radical SAM protein [Acutalibacteraceae bacterium]
MKNIYLAQPNNNLSQEVYLPYAAGTIAAYAFQNDKIKENYRLGEIIFLKLPVDEVVKNLENPFFVGFSSYMWNIEYNLALAERIKSTYPECIIAFGGPQIPDDTTYLEKYPFIDILMHGEGERTFLSLLLVLLEKGDLSSIKNISFRSEDRRVIHTEKEIFRNIVDYPSPYSMGIFDSIVENEAYSGLRFDAVLETNRGCPYSCIYCYWAGTESNFRQFGLERVFGDLDWMAKHKIIYCICADSNFGILKRDHEIAKYLVNLKNKYGYPQKFETSAAKNKDDFVFEINRLLNSANLNCGISVAVQSFSPTVLENIGRKNISTDNFAKQMEKYRNEGMSTYTDFILGLPGETYESFCQGLFCAIESGQHSSINVHPCEVLPNTVLYLRETIEKYDIKTIRSTLCQDHVIYNRENKFGSRSEIIVSTNTMSKSDWRRAMRLSVCVQSFHSFGLLKFFAVYLRKSKNVSYYDFYMSLFKWIESESSFTKRTLDRVCASIDSFLEEKSSLFFYDSRFSDSYLSFKEGLFLSCAAEIDEFFDDIKNYLYTYFNEEELFEDLFMYQKEIIKLPYKPQTEITVKYNWQDYFSDIFDKSKVSPRRVETRLVSDFCKEDNWFDYTRNNIWYGKRENKMLRKFEIL